MHRAIPVSEHCAALIRQIGGHGLDYGEIERRTKLSKNTIWRMANGEMREPKFDTVHRLELLAAEVAKRR